MPARRAISRSEACGSAEMISLAIRRPSALLRGRTRPSRPSREVVGPSTSIWPRMTPTVLADRPDALAIARSDQNG